MEFFGNYGSKQFSWEWILRIHGIAPRSSFAWDLPGLVGSRLKRPLFFAAWRLAPSAPGRKGRTPPPASQELQIRLGPCSDFKNLRGKCFRDPSIAIALALGRSVH